MIAVLSSLGNHNVVSTMLLPEVQANGQKQRWTMWVDRTLRSVNICWKDNLCMLYVCCLRSFSFCGHSFVVCVCNVCKSWKSDHFWQNCICEAHMGTDAWLGTQLETHKTRMVEGTALSFRCLLFSQHQSGMQWNAKQGQNRELARSLENCA